MKSIIQQRFLAVVLTIVALMAGQSVWAENTWTVENLSGSKFTITRSGDLSKAETVCYRTVSLTAVAGQHFTGMSGQLTFAANVDTREITVSEGTPTQEFYKYQNGSTRKYRFEVTDEGGFLLADCDRTITTGSSITSSDLLNKTKTAYIQSKAFTVTEDGYKQSEMPKTIASTSFYTAAQQGYLGTAGAELRMMLEFQAKEEYDGYQYLQILTNETDCDTGAGNGDPGTISKSRYMAGFEIKSGGEYKTYKSYTFPVTTVGSGVGATNPWGYDTDKEKFPLSKQKFNTDCRASDGALILPTNFQTLVVRFDASGGGEDDWTINNLKAKITAVDTQVPTLHDVKISGGPRAKGNTFYVSLAFKEIVRITGTTKKLSTSWGDLTYVDGDGTNVLTFSGTIGISATSPLVVNSLTGTVKDLSGNTFSTASVSHTFEGFILTASFAYPITYELNDGTVATANPTSYKYEDATFTLNAPTKEGNYYFAGWTGSNGDEPQKTVTISQGTHGALSYTAHWTQGYSVFFYANGGTSGSMSQQDFNLNETKALTANTFTRTYYIFNGWNTKADGSGTAYSDGQEVSNLASSGETVTLYAQWTPDIATHWQADTDHDGTTAEKSYIITTIAGLNLLADQVKNGKDFGTDDTHPNGYFFKLGNDIAYNCTCAWNNEQSSTKENNYTIIGKETHPFNGTFDGCGKTLSGIRVYQLINYVGLFARIGESGTVKNLTLSNTRIFVSQHNNIGAIAGYNLGTIENCCVTDNVCLVANGTSVGGIAGINGNDSYFSATIKDCTSSVTIKWGGRGKGGIVAQNYGKVEGCFADGVQIINSPYLVGAIAGSLSKNGKLTGNYYHNCTVNNSGTQNMMTNVGVGISDITSADKDGARGVAQITQAAEGISIDRAPVTFRNKSYYYSEALITLSYGGTEQDIAYEVKKTSDGNTLLKTSCTFEMPAYDVTIGTANSLWDGAGTEQSPYLITNTNEFAQLIYKIHGYKGATRNSYEGKYFQLNANLTFSGGSSQSNLNDAGTTIRDFKGIFNGNSKYITGITVSPTGDTDHSIFGDLNGGTVKNLTIKNSTIRVTASGNVASDYAFVCRNLKAGSIENVTVQNCTIDEQEGLTVNTMGAICATLESGTIGGRDKGCTVDNLKITVDGHLAKSPIINTFGGICGKVIGGTVSDCVCNKSDISLQFRESQYTGGIVGEVAMLSRDNHNLPQVTITACTFDNSNISNYQYAGGIVGKVDHFNCIISDCHTSNTIKNDGSITSYGSYAGGIVGWFNGDYVKRCVIQYCYNDRKVYGDKHVGGIAGYVGNCMVSYCYNYSDIRSAAGYMGGIAGELTGRETSIEKCFNTGDIDQETSHDNTLHTGGIVGYLNASNTNDQCVVAYSFNSYKVHGYNRVGGIAGTVEGRAHLEFCYNTGVVKGIAQVGGLIGLQKNAQTTFRCYSAGKVEGSSMVGAVCGYATSTSTPAANFSYCYYDNQMVAYKGIDDQDITGITSMTHASMIGSNFGMDVNDWYYSANHYPQLNTFSQYDASSASTLVFPLDATQNATNLHVYIKQGDDQISLPTKTGLTWKSYHTDSYLVIDNNNKLLAYMRGIYNFYILKSDDNSPLRAFEANFGISAQQPIEICDTATFRQFRHYINADQDFVYDPSKQTFEPSGSDGVVIPQSAEGFYFKLNYIKKEWEASRDYFFLVQEEPHDIRWDPIGDYVGNTTTSFKGKLDGNGQKIIFKCNRPDQDYIGLFGRMEGHIKNLKVAASFQRDDIYVRGHDYVGALAGFCNGTLENCSTAATDSSLFVPTVTGNDHVGALVGRAEFSKITGCDNAYCYVSGTTNVGEVYGSIDENTIVNNNSYSRPTPNQVALCDYDLEKPAGDRNPDRISALYAKTHSNNGDETSLVILPGRILYKDGAWNTICLPFDLALEGSPLEGTTLMELDTQGTYEGHKTGFDASTGTLYLYFKDATSIKAGTPYIIKWTKAAGYGPYDYKYRILHDVHNPEFRDVTIDNSETAINNMTVTSADGKVSFKGTYSYIPYPQTDKSVLFIGSAVNNNTEYYTYLYYPEVLSGAKAGRIGACRAYFQLNHGLTVGNGNSNVKAFHMNVDENTDGIGEISTYRNDDMSSGRNGSWYDLSGRRLDTRPTRRGIYLNNGSRVVIK